MVNKTELEVELVRHHMTKDQLAEAINMERGKFYRRLANPNDLTIGEVSSICRVLDLSQSRATEIFFAPEVA